MAWRALRAAHHQSGQLRQPYDAALSQLRLASGSQARLASVGGRRAGSRCTRPEHLRAPIDVDRGAGDRARALGAQEGDRKGEFVRAGLALDRVRFPRTLGAVLGGHAGVCLVVAYGVHEARVHVVHGNAILAEAGGQRLRQRAQRTLRSGVRDACPAAAIPVRAVDMDDAAPARRDHPRHEGLGQVPGGGELLVEEEVPVLVRGFEEGLVQAARRVADVNVHAPEGLFGAALRFLHGLDLAGSAHDHQGLRAQGLAPPQQRGLSSPCAPARRWAAGRAGGGGAPGDTPAPRGRGRPAGWRQKGFDNPLEGSSIKRYSLEQAVTKRLTPTPADAPLWSVSGLGPIWAPTIALATGPTGRLPPVGT